MRYLYTFLLAIATSFIFFRWLWRSRKVPGYRQRWTERLGYVSVQNNVSSIWIHAVSVGEFIAATPLIKALLEEYPTHTIWVTTTTPTGSSQVIKQFSDQVQHTYVPIDLPSAVNRFLARCRPALCIIMETELWPNLIYHTHARSIPILLANARLSERSCRGYQRIAKLTRQMLANITLVAAQSEKDGEQFVRLGLDRKKLMVAGNIKFDLCLPPSLLAEGKQLRSSWGNRPTIIAASTHEGEESIILNAFTAIQKKYSTALLLLVPRHPDRFDKVAKLCLAKGFRIAHRSMKQLPDQKTDILLGDTIGELRLLYAASDIALVGGSLLPVGGHNLIEPAALRLPILSGTHLHNFVAISQLLKEADAMILVENETDIIDAVTQLLENKSFSDAMGQRAFGVSAANTGALGRHLQWIRKINTV